MPVLSAAPDPGRLRSIRFTSWGFCGLQSRTLTQDSHPHLRASLKGTVQARDAVHTDYRMSGGMSVEGSEVRSGCVHPLSRSSWRKLSSHEPHPVVCSFRYYFCKTIIALLNVVPLHHSGLGKSFAKEATPSLCLSAIRTQKAGGCCNSAHFPAYMLSHFMGHLELEVMTGRLACHEIHKWYGPKPHSTSLVTKLLCGQALYSQLMPLQSMAQLYADHNPAQ